MNYLVWCNYVITFYLIACNYVMYVVAIYEDENMSSNEHYRCKCDMIIILLKLNNKRICKGDN